MRIECAFNAHWEISHSMRIGANAHSKWIESTSAQSTSRGGLKWIEHLCAYGTAPDRNPRDTSCVYIVANHPGMAGTVPEFWALSRCPGGIPGCPGIYEHLALRLSLA